MIFDDGYCFACGRDNPIGLHLSFQLQDDGTMVTEFVPKKEHQGYSGVVHGGILATLVDECMANLLISKGIEAVTAKMEVSYKSPVSVGIPVRVTAKIKQDKGKIIQMDCRLTDTAGELLTEAKAVFFSFKRT